MRKGGGPGGAKPPGPSASEKGDRAQRFLEGTRRLMEGTRRFMESARDAGGIKT